MDNFFIPTSHFSFTVPRLGPGRLSIELDRHKEKIIRLQFDFKDQACPCEFSEFAESLRNQPLASYQKIKVLDDHNFFPVLIFHQWYQNFFGLGLSLKHIQEEGEIWPQICRCFGITEGDLWTLASSVEKVDLTIINDETLAGTGCGSCKADLLTFIHDLKSMEQPDPMRFYKKRMRVKGLTPAQILKAIRPQVQKYFEEIELELPQEVRVDGKKVFLKNCPASSHQLFELSQRVLAENGLDLFFLSF